MKKIVLFFLKGYKKIISPIFDGIFGAGNTCRFSPTCSVYTYNAIDKYGVLKGMYLGLKRIIRCHPWNIGGYDPLA